MRISAGIALASGLAFAAGCGGAGAGLTDPNQKSAARASPPPDPVKGTPAWDEKGTEVACQPPEPRCENPSQPSIGFKDRCGLAGYRLIKCGCQILCTGNVSGEKKGYDQKGTEKTCEPPKPECPETAGGGAAFQDACTESGHKLLECGCEWLCSGKLKKPIVAPPPEDPVEEKAEDPKDKKKKK
jgi:hypothetical protein